MYRVIIVDDEPWTVRSITETVPWSKYDMQVTGSFSKATAALEAILAERPDAVFTDIRMPVISGIQLMQTLRERSYDTEIVVISGFDQFDFVRDSLRMGAFDYCLKPLDANYMDGLLRRMKDKLDQKAAERNNRLLEALTSDYVSGENKTVLASIPQQYTGYQAICINPGSNTSLLPALQKLPSKDYIGFSYGHVQYYLINAGQAVFDSFFISADQSCDTPGSIGFSQFRVGLRSIPALISEATVAAQGQFVSGQAQICLYHEPRIALIHSAVTHFNRLFRSASAADAFSCIHAIVSFMDSESLTIEEICFLGNQLILSDPGSIQRTDLTADALCTDWHDLLHRFSNAGEYWQHVVNACSPYLADDAAATELKESIIGRMLQYVDEHYTHQLLLKDLADKFYINKNYASLLFRRHTGMSYSDYLNNLRLNRAKELLNGTTLSISEVAEQSGYSDYFYFNKLFKKTFGITPAKYRRQSSAE